LTHILIEAEKKQTSLKLLNCVDAARRWLDGLEGGISSVAVKKSLLSLNEAVSHSNHTTGIVKQYPDISTGKAAEC